jgi:biotin operon repressor
MIDSGEVKSEADLARRLGISRVRVNQIVSVLKLDEQVIEMVEQLGNPMKSRIITERQLRHHLKEPPEKQRTFIKEIKKEP